MILVDRRVGSVDLHHLLPRGTSEVVELEYADAMWTGNGPISHPVIAAGVERKRLHDALACLQDNRFAAGQLPGLVDHFDVIYFVIEDDIRANPSTGILEKKMIGKGRKTGRYVPAVFGNRRQIMWRDFHHWLMSMAWQVWFETNTPMIVWFTKDAKDTATWLWSEYNLWQKKWSAHKSLRVMFNSDQDKIRARYRRLGIRDVPKVAEVAAVFEHVGYDKALALSQKFGSVKEFVNADEREYVVPKLIGIDTAKKIKQQIEQHRIVRTTRSK